MSFEIRAIALAGILALSSTAAQSVSPNAWGHQWRPSTGLGAAHAGFANAPSFRPLRAVGGWRQPGYTQVPRYPSPPQQYGRFGYPDAMPYTPYAATAYAGYGPLPSPLSRLPTPVVPAWGYPFNGMHRAWQPQPPLFARQFAWRPAAQPWLARSLAAAPIPYPASANPAYAQYRRPLAQALMPGSWRPNPRQLVDRTVGHRGQRRAAPWATAPVTPGWHTARLAGFNPPAPWMAERSWRPVRHLPAAWIDQRSWRPVGHPPGAVRQTVAAFRPVTRGRAEANSGGGGTWWAGGARDESPGRVTSYQEADFARSCGWCSGS
jgi:hypothetical protein